MSPALQLLGYLFAMACAVGALLSAVVRLKQKSLYESRQSLEQIRSLDWREFEHLMAEAFRREGYLAACTDDGADGGVDLVITKDGERRLVQCKQWRTQSVGVKPVRELAGVVAASGATEGVFVTAGSYTADARAFAREAGIRLIDAELLAQMLDVSAALPCGIAETCPRCGSGLVRRIARRGPQSGQAFLGCTSFPRCRFTRDVE